MDMKELCKKLFENEKIQDIPLEYVIVVVEVLFDIINSGDCYYDNNERSVYEHFN